MKPARFFVLLLLLLPVLSMAQLRATDLRDPAPVSVPAGVSQADAKKAVIDAMIARGWVVAEESDDHVVADLHIRDHWAQIHIAIGQRAIEISYVDSDNLRYEERRGRTLIHKNYIGWVENLAGDIRNHLARAQRNN